MRLQVSNAVYHYDAVKITGFKGISFSLGDGEVMSILGPNGCGKTTLLKCLNGLFKIQGGNITVDNRDLSRLPRNDIAKAIGYILNSTNLHSHSQSLMRSSSGALRILECWNLQI